MTLHCSSMEVMTVAVVQYRVQGGVSKNHCSRGLPPRATPALLPAMNWSMEYFEG